jgi:hypothetical protein
MIKDKIQHHKDKVKQLQEKYNNLVDSIKNAFYQREDYFDENSKFKPKSESAIMSAAYCLDMMIKPKSGYSFDVGFIIRRAEVFKSDPKIFLDYYYLHDDRFKTHSGTPSVFLLRKKDIKIFEDECFKAWKYVVNKSYDSTKLGFKEWVEATSCDDIVSILHEVLEERIEEVSDSKLKIKDVIIIYPSVPFKNYHF